MVDGGEPWLPLRDSFRTVVGEPNEEMLETFRLVRLVA